MTNNIYVLRLFNNAYKYKFIVQLKSSIKTMHLIYLFIIFIFILTRDIVYLSDFYFILYLTVLKYFVALFFSLPDQSKSNQLVVYRFDSVWALFQKCANPTQTKLHTLDRFKQHVHSKSKQIGHRTLILLLRSLSIFTMLCTCSNCVYLKMVELWYV